MFDVKLVAPVNFCVYRREYRKDTSKYLSAINRIAYMQKGNVVIDLSKVEYLSAAAALLLFAIVNRAQLCAFQQKRRQTIQPIFPKKKDNPEGHRYIVSSGLSKALVSGTFDKLEGLTKEINLFQSSTNAHEHSSFTSVFLARQAKFTQEQHFLLTSAISEAMLNVSHHAYNSPGFSKDVELMGGDRWWQCAWFNPGKDKVVFILCDLGMGITRSITRSYTLPNESPEEISAVMGAMTQGVTCTGDNGRGNGSEDIKRPIGEGCDLEKETLLILTGHTQYYYTSTKPDPICTYVDDELQGTLIEWSLIPTRGEK